MRANPAETFQFWANRHREAFNLASRFRELGARNLHVQMQMIQAEAFKKMERYREAVTTERG